MRLKALILPIVLYMSLLASCKDSREPVGEEPVYVSSVEVALPRLEVDTRISLSGNVLNWEEGDDIKLAYSSDGFLTAQVSRYTVKDDGGSSSASFGSASQIGWSPESDLHSLYVMFPFSAGISANAVTVDISTTQTQNNLTDYNVSNGFFMAGRQYTSIPEKIEASLEFPLSLLRIDLDVEGTTLAGEILQGITLESEVPIAGRIEYGFSTGTLSAADKTAVTLSFEQGTIVEDKVSGWLTLYPADLLGGVVVRMTTVDYEAVIIADLEQVLKPGSLTVLDIDLAKCMEEGKAKIEYVGDDELVSSNTYMLRPGSSLHIPVRRAYEVWEEYFDTDLTGKEATVNMLWEDHVGLVEYYGAQLITDDQNDLIRVKVSENQGNALIALIVDDIIRWSWHIWVTDYDPNASGATVTYLNDEFMLCNLGAANNTPGDPASAGYLYQWGRKDPFPGAFEFAGDTDKTRPVYSASGTVTGINLAQVAQSDNLQRAISNPTTFYYATEAPGDWYTTTPDGKNDTLWMDKEKNKTIFDPCPNGWRIPVSDHSKLSLSIWRNRNATNELVDYTGQNNEWKNGWDFNLTGYRLGYYPAGGYLDNMTGFMQEAGSYGTYWSAMAPEENTTAYRFTISSTTVEADGSAPRSLGSSVRCVRE